MSLIVATGVGVVRDARTRDGVDGCGIGRGTCVALAGTRAGAGGRGAVSVEVITGSGGTGIVWGDAAGTPAGAASGVCWAAAGAVAGCDTVGGVANTVGDDAAVAGGGV